MQLGIVIITYNNDQLLTKQIECIQCLDEHEITIVDNSSDPAIIESIRYHSERLHLNYMKVRSTSGSGSQSHSFAANLGYLYLKQSYNYFLFLDHDCFPLKKFSVIDVLGKNQLAGIGQGKRKTYLWPGCLMFDNSITDLVDFSPNKEFGLDTGGNLYKAVEKYKTKFFNEVHVQNPHFNKSFYNFYSLINEGMFMHFVNASNWNNSEHHEERINSLLNILDESRRNILS